MLRTVVFGWALVLMIGCGDGDESCGFNDRTYLVVRTSITGDCGTPPPELVMPAVIPVGCDQQLRFTDECGVQVFRDCSVAGGGQVRSEVTLTAMGDDYTGLAEYTAILPDQSCQGLYRVTWTAQ